MDRFILAFLGLLLLPRAAELLAPFILGFLIYLLCRRSVRRMAALGLGRGLGAFFSLAFVTSVALSLSALALILAFSEGARLPELYARLGTSIPANSLPAKFIEAFREELTEALKALAVSVISQLKNVTGFLLVLFIGLLVAFFLLRDEDKLVNIIPSNGGRSFFKNVISLKESFSVALSGYVRAQAILMCLIFVILALFFLLFGVKYALLAALGTALIDAIPVFGTGFVLLPWAFYKFLTGNAPLGFGLLALYGVCSLTRQILEPKILSSQIGLHPLFTLAGIFIGFKLFGIWGLILGPMLALVFVTYIQKQE